MKFKLTINTCQRPPLLLHSPPYVSGHDGRSMTPSLHACQRKECQRSQAKNNQGYQINSTLKCGEAHSAACDKCTQAQKLEASKMKY